MSSKQYTQFIYALTGQDTNRSIQLNPDHMAVLTKAAVAAGDVEWMTRLQSQIEKEIKTLKQKVRNYDDFERLESLNNQLIDIMRAFFKMGLTRPGFQVMETWKEGSVALRHSELKYFGLPKTKNAAGKIMDMQVLADVAYGYGLRGLIGSATTFFQFYVLDDHVMRYYWLDIIKQHQGAVDSLQKTMGEKGPFQLYYTEFKRGFEEGGQYTCGTLSVPNRLKHIEKEFKQSNGIYDHVTVGLQEHLSKWKEMEWVQVQQVMSHLI